MIRKAVAGDYPVLSRIWLDASMKAHAFVAREFWEGNLEAMRDIYLPNSETWVIEDRTGQAGFLSLMDNVLAALFVDPAKQDRGFGSQLIDKAKGLRSRLELYVYSENPRAVEFYRKHGFSVLEERRDNRTLHIEFVMEWRR